MVRCKIWLALVVCLVIFIYFLNFYLLNRLTSTLKKAPPKSRFLEDSEFTIFLKNVSRRARNLPPKYLNLNPRHFVLQKSLIKNFRPAEYDDVSRVFGTSNSVKLELNFSDDCTSKKKIFFFSGL